MDKKLVFGSLSLFSFVAILFTPADSRLWALFLVLGLIFLYGWLKSQ